MNGYFHQLAKYTRGSAAVADTTSETTSAVIDMADFDELTFIVELGDVDASAVLTFTVKENTASSTSSPTPTSVTLDSVSDSVSGSVSTGAYVVTEDSGNLDNKTILITVGKANLSKRYVFLSITASAESYEVVSIGCLQSKPRDIPVSQPSSVVATAVGVS